MADIHAEEVVRCPCPSIDGGDVGCFLPLSSFGIPGSNSSRHFHLGRCGADSGALGDGAQHPVGVGRHGRLAGGHL